MRNLTLLPVGTRTLLREVGGDRTLRRRLMEMGFLPGTPIRLLRRGDLNGLLEVEVRGCRLSLRLGEAFRLLVDDA